MPVTRWSLPRLFTSPMKLCKKAGLATITMPDKPCGDSQHCSQGAVRMHHPESRQIVHLQQACSDCKLLVVKFYCILHLFFCFFDIFEAAVKKQQLWRHQVARIAIMRTLSA
jgi:lysophospholipid acyltransferase (LPLAT)-like uncharacterized protein